MSDYTPSTEEVRHIYGNYLDDNVLKWGEAMAGEARKRFDRWLAEHDRKVAEKAWDEGETAGGYLYIGMRRWRPYITTKAVNPYREVSK